MALQFAVSTRNARADAVEVDIGVSPIVKIRTGAAPVDCAAADTGTVLSTINDPPDWMTTATGGTKAMQGAWQDTSADAAGIAGHFRIYTSGGTVCKIQGSITITGGGGNMQLDNPNIAPGQLVTVTAFSWTEGNP